MRLAMGDFATGWQKYEWRWHHKSLDLPRRGLKQPLWLGRENLFGRTILLHAEQGLGDTIQFARYAPLVARRGATVMLDVPPPLEALLASLRDVTLVRSHALPLPVFDYQCPLPSLPLALGTMLETIPAEVPYLSPPADRVEKWRALIGNDTPPRIGLAWAGCPAHKNDRNRSIPLALLRPLLGTPGGAPAPRFFALQKELREADRPILEAAPALTQLADQIDDFADTAAIIALLDLVITVDTSVAHLAGALGKPVWILLPFAADWRWMIQRSDSPWYPSARLFRQPAIGDWQSVVRLMCEALSQIIA
jgi:hypothetical protein